jgi:hypothetical protein
VTAVKISSFLDYYGGRWFAEVDTKFTYKGQTRTVVLFLQLEKGKSWDQVGDQQCLLLSVYQEIFYTDSSAMKKFLHPMSHELDFMNLIKVFQEPETVEYYFDENFRPDFKTLFLYEVKKEI